MDSARELGPLLKVSSYMGTLPFYDQSRSKFIHSNLHTGSLVVFLSILYVWFLHDIITNHVFEFLPYLLESCGVTLVVKAIHNSRHFTVEIFERFDKIATALKKRYGLDGVVHKINRDLFLLGLATILDALFAASMLRLIEVVWTESAIVALIIVYCGDIYGVQFALLRFTYNCLDGIYRALELSHADLDLPEDLKLLTRLHWTVCETVHIFNEWYGWSMLAQTAYVCLTLLVTIYNVILLGDIREMWEIAVIVIPLLIGLLLYMMVLYLRLMAMSVAIANLFDKVARKADEVYYNFLDVKWLVPALRAFSRQANDNRPKIQATKFFVMDYSLMIPFFALLSTFIIIIVTKDKQNQA